MAWLTKSEKLPFSWSSVNFTKLNISREFFCAANRFAVEKLVRKLNWINDQGLWYTAVYSILLVGFYCVISILLNVSC